MTTDEAPLSTGAELNAELVALLRRADANDVDVGGGWSCRNGDEHPDWDVVVTEVRKNGESDRVESSE